METLVIMPLIYQLELSLMFLFVSSRQVDSHQIRLQVHRDVTWYQPQHRRASGGNLGPGILFINANFF